MDSNSQSQDWDLIIKGHTSLFDIKFNDLDSIRSSHLVFNDSLEDWRTEQYDKYQLLASGIKI